MAIGTRDVTFDEETFYDGDELFTQEEEITPLIDFSMIPLIPSIVFESENPPIRNNEPNSHTNDDENSDEVRTNQELGVEEYNIYPQYLPTPEDSYLSYSDEFKNHEENHTESNSAEKNNQIFIGEQLRKFNYADIDTNNILKGSRTRSKRTKTPESKCFSYIIERAHDWTG